MIKLQKNLERASRDRAFLTYTKKANRQKEIFYEKEGLLHARKSDVPVPNILHYSPEYITTEYIHGETLSEVARSKQYSKDTMEKLFFSIVEDIKKMQVTPPHKGNKVLSISH